MLIRRLPAGPRAVAVVAIPVLLASCGDNQSELPPLETLQIKTLSNRADLVSGGDVLVEIVIPDGARSEAMANGLRVVAGGRDVTAAFVRGSDGRTLGLITGLRDGPNTVTADIGGRGGATLTVTNHKIGGPVFSGPQVTPWICAAAAPIAEVGDTPARSHSGLGGAASEDGQCNIASETRLYYRTTAAPPACTLGLPDPIRPLGNPLSAEPPPITPPANGCFKPYDPANPPGDLAMTTTDTGVTVPYIVRVERGTMNRGIYDIAVLYDPAQVGSDGWTSTAPPTTWNRKVLYPFGPSTGQPRRQQRSSQAWTAQDAALGRGFLVAVNSMTDSAFNSNRVAMTETVMMMKEYIADHYGEIRYMIGTGCSGGSINQLTAASIFPGLLDGIQPSCTYPDSETTGMEVADCEALVRFYASEAWSALMQGKDDATKIAKQAAINGHLDHRACRAWFNSFIGIARPGNYTREEIAAADLAKADTKITVTTTVLNNCTLPSSMVYSQTNPSGVRCTIADHATSVWGKLTDANRAPSTRDNVGVVYGLDAFRTGVIDAEEFVTLNENIGGADGDLQRTTARSVADTAALEIAYRAGIVTDGRRLAQVPIIDLRGYDEQGIHLSWRSVALRARLDAANGGHGNHLLWRFGTGAGTGLTPLPQSGLTVASLDVMDRWLTAMKSDAGTGTLAQRVIATRPADGFDFCYMTGDTAFSTKVQDAAVCDSDVRLRPNRSPRQVAGGPASEDILKCQLKPFVDADYPGLTPEQLARLETAFPTGVCDWTRPGVGQQAAVSPLDFRAGPGGQALPAAPSSRAL